MKLDDLVHEVSEWLKGSGPDPDIVISSRVRLARNIQSSPFVHWANRRKGKSILSKLEEAVGAIPHMKSALFLRIDELTETDKQFLLERHLISHEHAQGGGFRGVAISDREVISIMLNEEDHLRIQVLQSGFNLSEAWRLASSVDRELEQRLELAYSPSWGYLTACPTNTGTGLRASVMVHLPCLMMTKQIGKVLQALNKLSLAARGLFGEGTEAAGNFFQFSNQVTLGQSEEDIIDNLERVIRQIIDHEKEARKVLLGQNKEKLFDQIWRSYGTLRNSYIINSQETINLMSLVRLGVDMGIVSNIDRKVVNELFILTQPAHLQKLEGKDLTPQERDVKRAELIRGKLNHEGRK
ncbi:MAG: protein arginine kinase [Candidatus Omnitrophica bacterium]|nr:protein arginine kinase [Candidatus Omnitrophota bacterium]